VKAEAASDQKSRAQTKKAATEVTALSWKRSFRPDSVCVSLMWPFAQSPREPFSPRSSEPVLHKLAKALLRVCVPEVKKKFRGVQKEKRVGTFYFVDDRHRASP
jgi:hypothetical protein